MSANLGSTPLASLLAADGGQKTLVARGANGSVSAASLCARAAAIAIHLPDATPGSEVAFSFGHDQVGFAAGLLAAWSRGHTAALPEDEHRDNIVPLLEREENAAFLHDTGVGLGIHVPSLLEARLVEGTELPWTTPFEADRAALIAFRQEAIGEARSWRCTPEELSAQAESLADRAGLGQAVHVASSYSPSSIPGLLLGLLAPLRRGGTFAARTMRPDEPGFDDQAADVWLGSPAHGRTLARRATRTAKPSLYCIADGDVDPVTEERLALDGARLARLAPLPLDDERTERVCALEAELLAHESIVDAVVASCEVDGTPKTLVAVVLEANADVLTVRCVVEAHVDEGVFELGAFPALPRNENGRLPGWRTALAFGIGRRGQPLETTLSWSRVSEEAEGGYRFRTRVPEHYAFFEGHYTSYPILAGAVQLHELVLPCIREVAPDVGAITQLTGLKFLSRIAPGDEVDVVIRRTSPKDYRFDIESADTRCSVGQVRFEETQGESS